MLNVIESGGAFNFSDENQEKIKTILAKYPDGRQRSAVMPLLYLAQAQNGGWVSSEAVEKIAEILSLPRIQVIEVATFYTMFNLKPIGRYHVQLCGTTPCWLRGSDEVMRACKDMGLEKGKSTDDMLFHLTEVECLGACCNAPMVQINDDFYEDLDYDRMTAILKALKRGEVPPPGPQNGRQASAPEGGPLVLRDMVPAAADKE
ncbi:NADH dehydrogenase [Iodidimonas nitroreducens]|uniref:NADH dehydrogenase n=1 Tax=Iodidimonas nitroreducens TaxID=1236968 RepID=A0A5A7N496_9PROT|nr:NADH-quinone oxidoreductase subunit NuoE [Iodidimonas nitroreducens]GAK32925.1 NADH dehydrogenase [ubiquinone] flavoprotein 2, mitochondrial [alpha proteobacterium Q-1]GER03092.1 NADH dehydrogenase [Iodidimonas nitroreducens]